MPEEAQYVATYIGAAEYLIGGIWETVGLATISGVFSFATLGTWIDLLVARRDPQAYALLRKTRGGRE